MIQLKIISKIHLFLIRITGILLFVLIIAACGPANPESEKPTAGENLAEPTETASASKTPILTPTPSITPTPPASPTSTAISFPISKPITSENIAELQEIIQLAEQVSRSRIGVPLTWSPDGVWLGPLWAKDSELTIWNRFDWKPQNPEPNYRESWNGVPAARWFLDSSKMKLFFANGNIGFWSVQDNEFEMTFDADTRRGHPIELPVWSPDSTRIAGKIWETETDETVTILDGTNGAQLQGIKAHSGYIDQLAWSPDGTMLATTAFDGYLKLWNATSWENLASWDLTKEFKLDDNYPPISMAWSPDSKHLAIDSPRGIAIWSVPERSIIQMIELDETPRHLAWSPDGLLLGAAFWRQDITIFGLEGFPLLKIPKQDETDAALAWSPDGALIATVSKDGFIRIWGIP